MTSGGDSNALHEALEAAKELRVALRDIGIVLPGIGVDLPAAMSGLPLVTLGSADAATVKRITEALHQRGA